MSPNVVMPIATAALIGGFLVAVGLMLKQRKARLQLWLVPVAAGVISAAIGLFAAYLASQH